LTEVLPRKVPNESFVVMTLNTWKRQGAYKARLRLMAEEIGRLDPDILLLQECFAAAELGYDTTAAPAGATGFHSASWAGFARKHPPSDGQAGAAGTNLLMMDTARLHHWCRHGRPDEYHRARRHFLPHFYLRDGCWLGARHRSHGRHRWPDQIFQMAAADGHRSRAAASSVYAKETWRDNVCALMGLVAGHRRRSMTACSRSIS
jgi:hypothetical protein